MTSDKMASKILIVDDDERILFTTKRLLETWGYEVDTAANWKTGFVKAMKEKVDLVLLDIMMPEVSGTTVFTEIKKRKPEMKIMFVSAVTPPQDIQEQLWKEGIPFLRKPFEPDILRERVEKVLGKRD